MLVNCLNLQTTGATLFDLYLNLLNLRISLPEDWNFNLEQFQVCGHSMNDQTIWLTKYFIHRKLAYKLTTVSNWQLFITFNQLRTLTFRFGKYDERHFIYQPL